LFLGLVQPISLHQRHQLSQQKAMQGLMILPFLCLHRLLRLFQLKLILPSILILPQLVFLQYQQQIQRQPMSLQYRH
jgi:hypothetical protein